jgi:hypothetical protein
MAFNYPNSPTDGDYFTDAEGQRWLYEASTTSWTKVGVAAYTGTVAVGTQTLTFDDGVLLTVT